MHKPDKSVWFVTVRSQLVAGDREPEGVEGEQGTERTGWGVDAEDFGTQTASITHPHRNPTRSHRFTNN